MLVKLEGGRVFDPIQGWRGEPRDLFVDGGRIVDPPADSRPPDRVIDLTDLVVMAGAIDLHSHIGGGKVNIARMLLLEDHLADRHGGSRDLRAGSGFATPSTFLTGRRYAEMGYTAVFEPAMLPVNARQAHNEMADIPLIDKGAYVLLGNDDFLLRLLAEGAGMEAVREYVAWTLHATQALAVKVVNPGGISAFKFNGRRLDLDEQGPHYGIAPRAILLALARALSELGVPHPLHVHGCNLGVAGNVETTLRTIEALDGLPAHLTHIQFHSYGAEGRRGFSSGAARLAEAVNRSPHLSVDVGQVMFGRTVTASADTMAQYRNSRFADPKKWLVMDIECEAGCGVVPFRYRERSFVNALQWAIGLELFLLVDDPWRIFLTTDHPNGAPFHTYPHLIRLLMDRDFRKERLASIHPHARALSCLQELEREYSLHEIAILTRAGPARSLGLSDRGHLGPGAVADITVYEEHADKERMFARPAYVIKDGEIVVRDGALQSVRTGATHVVRPGYDPAIERRLEAYFRDYRAMRLANCRIADDEIEGEGRGRIVVHPCRGGTAP